MLTRTDPAPRRNQPSPRHVCRGCGASDLAVAYERAGIPVHSSLLLATRAEARAFPTGSVALAACSTCGLVQNVAFDPTRVHYDSTYEDSQAHSDRFVDFARDLARDLGARSPLAGRRVLEVGCGSGDFLALLSEETGCRGIGLDPAYRPSVATVGDRSRLDFRAEPFPAGADADTIDLVICRHTLEHGADPAGFVRSVREWIGTRSIPVVFEVPDADRILAEDAFWDVYYEHVSYFTADTLRSLFERAGFSVTDLRAVFDDQYLVVEAIPATTNAAHPDRPADARISVAAVHGFAARVDHTLDHWRSILDADAAAGRRVALWGAGSKAVAFLAGVGRPGTVERVVDVNPRKHGGFLPGTGLEVVAPHSLRDTPPDRVIVMNPAYLDEIRRDLADLGLTPEVVVL